MLVVASFNVINEHRNVNSYNHNYKNDFSHILTNVYFFCNKYDFSHILTNVYVLCNKYAKFINVF